MREILGYAPVEPDGSVRVQGAGGRRLRDDGARRQRPAHRRRATTTGCRCAPARNCTCNGCHDPDRARLARPQQPVRGGERRRPRHRRAVPEHESGAVRRLRRDDGAGARAHQLPDRLRRPAAPAPRSATTDVWTDPVAAGRAPDAPFSYDYADLETPAPTTPDCVTAWRAGCRITIHYERHIHPLWSMPRVTLAADGSVAHDDTCIELPYARATRRAPPRCRPPSWN